MVTNCVKTHYVYVQLNFKKAKGNIPHIDQDFLLSLKMNSFWHSLTNLRVNVNNLRNTADIDFYSFLIFYGRFNIAVFMYMLIVLKSNSYFSD